MIHMRVVMMSLVMVAQFGLSPPKSWAAEVQSAGQGFDTYGVIQTIFLETREANISGYRYRFTDLGDDASEVQLLGFSAGSLELLVPGMKVWVIFEETSDVRQVIFLEQIPESEEVAH
jgi:hypothetical protein